MLSLLKYSIHCPHLLSLLIHSPDHFFPISALQDWTLWCSWHSWPLCPQNSILLCLVSTQDLMADSPLCSSYTWSLDGLIFPVFSIYIQCTQQHLPFCLKMLLPTRTPFECPTGTSSNFFKLHSHSPSLYFLYWWMALSFIQMSKPETWEFTQVIPSIAPHNHLKDLSTVFSSWPPICC